MNRISAIIEKVCRKLDIEYLSPQHGDLLERQKDAQKLSDIYLQLKEILGVLIEIAEKYKEMKILKNMVERNINQLDIIDHDIIIEARKISSKNDKN